VSEIMSFHPVVDFTYFAFVIVFSCLFMDPMCLAASLVCAFIYSATLGGSKAVRSNILYMIPVLLLTTLLNPAFNHGGVTVLAYFPSGNPLTLESIMYGAASGVMLVSVICWFLCYSRIMTSDKIIYLFGRVIPSLSLILSMTLRFVPRFSAKIKEISRVRRCMGNSTNGLFAKIKRGLDVLSASVTWALENAVDTADSMKARGYGLHGRTTFSVFRFDSRDARALLVILSFGIYTLVGLILGAVEYYYFPILAPINISVYGISVRAAYFALLIYPVINKTLEVRKWNALRSKI